MVPHKTDDLHEFLHPNKWKIQFYFLKWWKQISQKFRSQNKLKFAPVIRFIKNGVRYSFFQNVFFFVMWFKEKMLVFVLYQQ